MNRRGRPPVDPTDRSTPVSLKLPGRLYDRVYAAAERERVSVSQVIRRAIQRDLEIQNRRG